MSEKTVPSGKTGLFESDPLLQEMIKVMVDTIHPHQILLFGSQARGSATAGSDFDFVIVTDQQFDRAHSRREEMAQLWRQLARFRVPKDILIYSRDEIERWRHTKNHVIARAFKEGKLLYERS
jgi:predicted nucleotidyltransferase